VSHTSLKTVLKQQAYILFYTQIIDTPPTSKPAPVSITSTTVNAGLSQSTQKEKPVVGSKKEVVDQEFDIGEELAALETDPVKRLQYKQMSMEKHKEKELATIAAENAANPCADQAEVKHGAGRDGDGDGGQSSSDGDSDVSSDVLSDDIRLKKRHAWQLGAMR
jgi:hypothetical protein